MNQIREYVEKYSSVKVASENCFNFNVHHAHAKFHVNIQYTPHNYYVVYVLMSWMHDIGVGEWKWHLDDIKDDAKEYNTALQVIESITPILNG